MDYLLYRAKQELDVYFCKEIASKEIILNGKSKIIYTMLLKGKKIGSVYNYFSLLCRNGKVYDDDEFLLKETMQKFNDLYKKQPAFIS